MTVRFEVSIPAALARLATVLLLAAVFPCRAHGFPADAPLASGGSTPRTEGAGDACREATAESQEAAAPRRRPWLVLGEVTAVNAAVWSVDWFLRKRDWAEVDPDVWARNLTGGFKWDADKFTANQFDHPYHGGVYYNLARDNGFTYWESGVVTFLGSFQWEVFAENNPPSTNDIINTSLGGLAIGEVLYRLSSRVLDNCATGRERVGREVFAGLLNPGRGFNRIVRGEAWRVGPTPREWTPPLFAAFGQAGYLQEGDGADGADGPGQIFVGLGLRSGDPFQEEFHRPFDSFALDASFVTRQGHLLSQAEIQGLLAVTALKRRPGWQLLLGAYQFYDFLDIGAYVLGSQSFSGSLLFRRELEGDVDLRAALHLRGVALAAISSDPSETDGRGYDYGPGVGATLRVAVGAWPWEYVSLEVEATWVHTLNGAPDDHLIYEGRLQADIPIYRGLGLGGSLQLFRRDSLVPNQEDETRQTPQFQLFVSWH